MKIGPKYKIAKRLGATVFEKTMSQKFAIAKERSEKTRKRGRGPSEFGKQLLEKQKVRLTYGLSEKQFANYVAEAMETRGVPPVETLHKLLEIRLDSVVYRLGLAKTRRASRQMVSHGHITVNGVKSTIPSRRMRQGDVVAIRDGSKSSVMFEGLAEKLAERPTPSWLSWDVKQMSGSLADMPTAASADPAGDLGAVLSFYSR
ncbi:MAG: 30S ribosomal protein S4 [Candidatus Pacebacteria bacterium]|nr:30S ribosomal protein S4 [Candidatus Paceibacterota bacterium]MBP9840513.1 30S ribosomal protein S4 [Candidatus Paceibacterota bacterium]